MGRKWAKGGQRSLAGPQQDLQVLEHEDYFWELLGIIFTHEWYKTHFLFLSLGF